MSVDPAKVLPWNADTPSLLTGTLSHVASAWLVLPEGEEIALDLRGGVVSFDERRAPRVEANLTCRMTTVEEVIEAIDPRASTRLCVEVGYSRPDGAVESYQIVDLGLRARYVTRPDDVLTVRGASDEALIIDASPGVGGTLDTADTVGAIEELIHWSFPGVTVTNDLTNTGPAINEWPYGDKWGKIADLSDSLDAKTYDDGMRNWNIAQQANLTTPALELAVGAGGTIIESEAGIDRDEGWYNRVILRYEWRDSAGVEHRVNGNRKITSGDYAATGSNVRAYEETREFPTNQTRAHNAAAALVRRTVTRGRTFRVRAVSAYWLRPGYTVSVTLPLGDTEEHIVTSVAFDLFDGTMTVETRLPDNTGTIGA